MRKPTLALAATIFVSSCQTAHDGGPSQEGRSPRHGGTIVLSSWGGPKTFNPIVSNESSSTEFSQYIFAGLTDIDARTGQPKPQLAESWTTDSSGKVYTFKLRPGLSFNDGSPLRASDVVFTWNKLAFDTAVECAMRDILMVDGKLPQVKALDSLTVEFRLPTVFGPFLAAAGGLPILSERRLGNKTGIDFNSVYGITTPPDSLIGAGPFRLVRYEPGSRGIYVPNPHWYKKDSAGNSLPYLDTILLTIVQDQKAEVLKFKAGEIDVMAVTPQDFPVIKPLEAEGNFSIRKLGPSLSQVFLFFNQNQGKDKKGKPFVDPVKLSWFTDVRFRRAVSWAIDRRNIRDIVWNGLGGDVNGPFSPSSKYWWNSNLPFFRKDIDSANAALAAAGFTKGADGKLRDAKGNQVKFTLLTNTENQMRIDMAGLIRKDLEALGIEVMFVQVEFNALVSRLDASFDWDATLLGLSGGGSDPHFGANVWISSGRTHMWFPKQKKPATAWEATLDSLVIAGVTTADTATRKKAYDSLQSVVHHQQPYIYLGHPETMYAIRNRFGNVQPTVLGGALHNIDEIYVLR
ncbi:MAG TPA: ABC transporter substrate-binding protein [Fibrobacteria bacterium]|nr:ABC transporter substrate-binding protein [Fibrobacteria bacterium]HOX50430.1 ABC transporter substrate-binding protein [Fibrobacteria bacterium]